MGFYLSLLLLPPAGAIASQWAVRARGVIFFLVAMALIVVIGLRDRVGCDWNDYLLMSLRSRTASLGEALTINDHGYMLVNWLAAQAGLSIGLVNLVCASLLVLGLFLFCRKLPRPWLALLIAMPVLILIAGFSATRQSVAAGLFLAALSLELDGRRPKTALLLVLAAATFHISAVLLLPLLLLIRWGSPGRAMFWLVAAPAAGAVAVLGLMMIPQTASLAASQPHSGGAWMRAMPSLLALLAFPFVWQRATLTEKKRAVMFWLAGLALACLVVGFASPYLMDRLGFYAIPFQMIVLTYAVALPSRCLVAGALAAAIATPFVLLFAGWLAIGTSASCAIPYRSLLAHPERLLIENTATLLKFNRVTDPWGPLRPYVHAAEERRNADRSRIPPEAMQID